MELGRMLAIRLLLICSIAITGLYGQLTFRGKACIRQRLNSKGKKSGLLLCAGFLSGLALPAQGAVEINYTYDDLNRLGAAARSDGPAMAFHYDEAGNLTDQSVSNSPDTDGDQITNFADADDDGDGMPDAWEIQYGFNPLSPADAGQDADHDGVTNLAEYLAGTNPLQPPAHAAAILLN